MELDLFEDHLAQKGLLLIQQSISLGSISTKVFEYF